MPRYETVCRSVPSLRHSMCRIVHTGKLGQIPHPFLARWLPCKAMRLDRLRYLYRSYQTGARSIRQRIGMVFCWDTERLQPQQEFGMSMHPELRTRGGGSIHGEEAIEGRVYVCSTDDTAAAAVCAYEDTIFRVPYWN